MYFTCFCKIHFLYFTWTVASGAHRQQGFCLSQHLLWDKGLPSLPPCPPPFMSPFLHSFPFFLHSFSFIPSSPFPSHPFPFLLSFTHSFNTVLLVGPRHGQWTYNGEPSKLPCLATRPTPPRKKERVRENKSNGSKHLKGIIMPLLLTL